MNYFRCTVGGSGKGNTVTVTCAEEFAGLTITLSKTGKTYTKTCPSTSPYVVTFYGVENGTYTVSCTVDGQTFSETVVVQDISCVLNYGFSWKIWVDTASQLDSSDYDSLDEVLADEKALRELFLEHACVDYMAEATSSNANLETIINDDYCAKWINNSDYALDFLGANTVIKALMDTADKYGYGEWVITDDTTTPPTWGPKGNVPVMTANTAPYGEASASSERNDSTRAWKLFDGTTYAMWQTNAVTTNSWVQYKFTNPICAKRVKIRAFYAIANGNWKIQASNDGTTFTDILVGSVLEAERDYTFALNNSDYYIYYRLFVASHTGNQYITMDTLQFYGRELKVSVPTMTSNTAPYGVASAINEMNNYGVIQAAWRAFMSTNASQDCWISQEGTNVGAWIGYNFEKPVIVKMFTMRNRNDSPTRTPSTFTLKGSNDNVNWESIEQYTNNNASQNALTIYNVSNGGAYKYYRIYVDSVSGSASFVCVGKLQFYGLDYSEKEFEAGTTKKWLYDHGVNVDEVTVEAATFNADCVVMNTQYSKLQKASFDTTSYSLMRAKIGSRLNGTLKFRVMDGSTTLATADFIAGDLPNNNSLSIASVNQTANIQIYQPNASSIAEVAEWWLE